MGIVVVVQLTCSNFEETSTLIAGRQPPIIHLIALAFRLGLDHSFEDTAVSEEAAEHEFQLVQTDNDLSEAWFELK